VVVDPNGTLGPPPDNVLLQHRIPQLELLPRVQAVICHAGHNTVCEALFEGVPLVVAPIRDDQPVIAQQVIDAGVAIRLRFGRASADIIGAAVDEILADESYRDNAQRISVSLRAAGGAKAAARYLEQLTWR
jgi:MGT family glycosyltransferase